MNVILTQLKEAIRVGVARSASDAAEHAKITDRVMREVSTYLVMDVGGVSIIEFARPEAKVPEAEVSADGEPITAVLHGAFVEYCDACGKEAVLWDEPGLPNGYTADGPLTTAEDCVVYPDGKWLCAGWSAGS